MKCWTCGGIPPESGRVCICGGTGWHEDEVNSLRATALSSPYLKAAVRGSRAHELYDRIAAVGDTTLKRKIVWQWIKQDLIDFKLFCELAPSLSKLLE
jgi:hypothetical protein